MSYLFTKKETIIKKIINNKDLQQELFTEMLSEKNKITKINTFILRIFVPLIIGIPYLFLFFYNIEYYKALIGVPMVIIFMILMMNSTKNYENIFNWFFFLNIKQDYINKISLQKISLTSYEILSNYLDKDEMSVLLDNPLSYKDLGVNLYPAYLEENNLKEKRNIEKINKDILKNEKNKIKENFLEDLYKNKK